MSFNNIKKLKGTELYDSFVLYEKYDHLLHHDLKISNIYSSEYIVMLNKNDFDMLTELELSFIGNYGNCPIYSLKKEHVVNFKLSYNGDYEMYEV